MKPEQVREARPEASSGGSPSVGRSWWAGVLGQEEKVTDRARGVDVESVSGDNSLKALHFAESCGLALARPSFLRRQNE